MLCEQIWIQMLHSSCPDAAVELRRKDRHVCIHAFLLAQFIWPSECDMNVTDCLRPKECLVFSVLA